MTDNRDWRERARGWTANHFSLSDVEANVPRLLRSVADKIEELEHVEILDVVLSEQMEGPRPEWKATVYFSFSDETM